jgi:hypothetical protein
LAGIGFERVLIGILVGQGMALAYQRCGVVCSNSGNLSVEEGTRFGVRQNRFCRSNSQLVVA